MKIPSVAGTDKELFLLNRSFGLLWLGQTVSLMGSHITSGALQIVAVLALGATPLQMSVLAALNLAPALLIGLLAGVWTDRVPRRPILLIADLIRALLLLTIPLAALLKLLRIEHIYIVTVLVGVLSVFFEVAYRTFLPTLLQNELLVEGNSKLSASESLAEVAGPSLAGWLIQALTAPLAIFFDALSFLLSAFAISLIRTQEHESVPVSERVGVWQEMRMGWQVLLNKPVLRVLAACAVSCNFSGGSFVTLYTLFTMKIVGLAPIIYGLLGTMAGVGELLAALFVSKITRSFASKPLIIVGLLLLGTMALLTPLIGSNTPQVIALLLASQLFGGLGGALYNIRSISLRQMLIPERFAGRVNACMYVLTAGATLSGALIAGIVAEFIGIRLTLIIGACGMALSGIWLFFMPLRLKL